jgi:hypothetical protein
MQPQDLRAEDFARYPSKGRAFAVANLSVLRKMPLAVLPAMLGQIIDYDWRFPAERRDLAAQFHYLEGLSPAALSDLVAPFSAIHLPATLGDVDWVNQPKVFEAQLSATLWSLHEIDAYRDAAERYRQQVQAALPEQLPAVPRLTIVIVGRGVQQTSLSLFRPLRPHGALFTNVDPESGLQILLDALKARVREHPEEYAHWYIEGGEPDPAYGSAEGIAVCSYGLLAPTASQELKLLQQFVERASRQGPVGVEAVTSYLASLTPEDLKLEGGPADAPLRRFEADILTQGAGTQVFSTTFVQWAARECLHRAQPLSLLARFAPRQRQAPMNELLTFNPLKQPVDVEGSLVDADMGAYYTWINQQRLPGADSSRFLAWFESHNVVLAIAPGLPRGTTSNQPADMKKILQWMA